LRCRARGCVLHLEKKIAKKEKKRLLFNDVGERFWRTAQWMTLRVSGSLRKRIVMTLPP
jgi:hypothetical protein